LLLPLKDIIVPDVPALPSAFLLFNDEFVKFLNPAINSSNDVPTPVASIIVYPFVPACFVPSAIFCFIELRVLTDNLLLSAATSLPNTLSVISPPPLAIPSPFTITSNPLSLNSPAGHLPFQ
jgi:hypothetical protein